jgi:hypothetical protein
MAGESSTIAALQTEMRLTRETLTEFRAGLREDLNEHRRQLASLNDRVTKQETETAANRRWIKGLIGAIPLAGVIGAIFGYKGLQ